MDERYSHPYSGVSNGVGGQSSASFASSSKLRPPTYLAQAPTFSSPKPRQSSGSLRRSIVGDSSIDSIHKEVIASSSLDHSNTTQRRKGRKSAFDTFDELSFCNDLASKIANELAARPPRNLRRSFPIDPWRGTIPGSNAASASGQEGPNIHTTDSLDVAQNGVEDQRAEQLEEDDESEDDDESDSEEESEEDDEEDVGPDDAALDAERTERTRLATEAFLQRLAERKAKGDNVDESEKGLEKQVFEIFGGGNENLNKEQEILASTDQLEQEEEVSPEVAMQVAQMLQKPAMQSQSGQRPLIQEVDQQAEPREILADSSMEYDQLKSTSSEAANLEDGLSGDRESESEDEIEEEGDDVDSIPGEAAIEREREREDGEEDEEDEDEDNESEGVEEDYYDDSQHHQHLYSQLSRSNSMGMYGSNQEEAISLIDSDEEDERPANPQPADYNQIAYDAARYERYQDGLDDEQEDYEEEQEDEMENDEEEEHAQNGMELLEEDNHQLPAIDAALFQDNQSVPVFEPALASSMPSDPSHLWQDSIQQSIQALTGLAQAPPAVFEENVAPAPTSFQTSMPQAAFSPNLFEQAFPASSTSVENQAAHQITPQDSIWSSFPVPRSPAPPPPAEAEAIGTADGEALLQLKAQVNEQIEEQQERSHRTSVSPIPPSTVQTPQANQSMPGTPKPTAGHVKDGRDLVDLKNVVKRAAGLQSQPSSVASDLGTPRNDILMPNDVQPIVEEEEVPADENLVNTTEATLDKVEIPPAVEEEEGEEVLVDENLVNAVEIKLEKVDIPPAVEEEVLVDENPINTTENTLEKVDLPPAVEEEEGEEVHVHEDPVNTTGSTIEKVDASPADRVLKVVKEDLIDADEDKALEEAIKVDHSIPEVEVNIEAATADEDVKASGLTEEAEAAVPEVEVNVEAPFADEDVKASGLTEEPETAIVVPATEEREQEPVSVTENLTVPDEVDMQEVDSKHANQNEVEEAIDTSPAISATRKGSKRGSVSEAPVEGNVEIGDAVVPVAESRRETRSSTKRAASEALSTKSEHETDHHHHQTHSSPHSHRKPRKSDPDGDLADYVPDDIRRKRMRSRTRSPSVARETVLPTSIGIPDKLLDTSILEEDEGEEDEEEQQQEEEEQAPSSTPVKRKRGRKPKKKTEAIEQSTQESLPEQSSTVLQPDSQSSQPDSNASPRKKTEAEKREYKKNQKRTYDKKRRRSTRNMDSNSAVEGNGEETSHDDSQKSKNDVEPKAKGEALALIEDVQPTIIDSSPPKRVTRRRTRQLTGEQEAGNSESQGADQKMAEVENEAEQQDENKRGAKKPRRGRSKDKR